MANDWLPRPLSVVCPLSFATSDRTCGVKRDEGATVAPCHRPCGWQCTVALAQAHWAVRTAHPGAPPARLFGGTVPGTEHVPRDRLVVARNGRGPIRSYPSTPTHQGLGHSHHQLSQFKPPPPHHHHHQGTRAPGHQGTKAPPCRTRTPVPMHPPEKDQSGHPASPQAGSRGRGRAYWACPAAHQRKSAAA